MENLPDGRPKSWQLRDFKINNNYTPYFARYFNHLYPDHANLFELREAESIENKKAFWAWIKQNQWVWDMFVAKCFKLIEKGQTRVSADMVVHSVRFDISLEAS